MNQIGFKLGLLGQKSDFKFKLVILEFRLEMGIHIIELHLISSGMLTCRPSVRNLHLDSLWGPPRATPITPRGK